jgi:uncharacterized membrane protein YjgN (DUF898 family)
MSEAAALTSDAPVAAAIAAALAVVPQDARARIGVASAAPRIVRQAAVHTSDATAGMSSGAMPFVWTGSPWSLVGTCLFNAFMTLITVGVYSFWGRTEIRRRLWASVRLDGEPLAYHGTGLELFKGFLGALLVVLLPIFLISMVLVVSYGQASSGWAAYQVALFAVVYPVLKALATYRARRYRLSRTSWRGIRGSVSGSSGEFAFLSWATSLLYPLTLGWIAPWRALYIQRFLIGDTMLGNRGLKLAGSTPRLYVRFGLLWIGTVAILICVAVAIGALIPQIETMRTPADWNRVTRLQWLQVGGVITAAVFVWSMISSFYRSTLYNMTADGTTFLLAGADATAGVEAPRFHLETRGPSLLWLYVTNQIITYGSLFVLRPVATARSMRYFVRNLSIVGAFTPATLLQNPNVALTEGEGLAQAFDFDAF